MTADFNELLKKRIEWGLLRSLSKGKSRKQEGERGSGGKGIGTHVDNSEGLAGRWQKNKLKRGGLNKFGVGRRSSNETSLHRGKGQGGGGWIMFVRITGSVSEKGDSRPLEERKGETTGLDGAGRPGSGGSG